MIVAGIVTVVGTTTVVGLIVGDGDGEVGVYVVGDGVGASPDGCWHACIYAFMFTVAVALLPLGNPYGLHPLLPTLPLKVTVTGTMHEPVHSFKQVRVAEQPAVHPLGRLLGCGFWLGETFGNWSGGALIEVLSVTQSPGDMVPVLSDVESTLNGDGTDILIVPEPSAVPMLHTVINNVPLKPWLVVHIKLFVGLIPNWEI